MTTTGFIKRKVETDSEVSKAALRKRKTGCSAFLSETVFRIGSKEKTCLTSNSLLITSILPNVVVEWLTFLLHIRGSPGFKSQP
jgi:hypothetical protein